MPRHPTGRQQSATSHHHTKAATGSQSYGPARDNSADYPEYSYPHEQPALNVEDLNQSGLVEETVPDNLEFMKIPARNSESTSNYVSDIPSTSHVHKYRPLSRSHLTPRERQPSHAHHGNDTPRKPFASPNSTQKLNITSGIPDPQASYIPMADSPWYQGTTAHTLQPPVHGGHVNQAYTTSVQPSQPPLPSSQPLHRSAHSHPLAAYSSTTRPQLVSEPVYAVSSKFGAPPTVSSVLPGQGI